MQQWANTLQSKPLEVALEACFNDNLVLQFT